MVKAHRFFCVFFSDGGFFRKFHDCLCIQDLFHTSQTGHGAAHSNDQVRQFYQLYQDLAHIIYQSHNITAHQHPGFHGAGTGPENSNDPYIHYRISKRIHQCRNPSYK